MEDTGHLPKLANEEEEGRKTYVCLSFPQCLSFFCGEKNCFLKGAGVYSNCWSVFKPLVEALICSVIVEWTVVDWTMENENAVARMTIFLSLSVSLANRTLIQEQTLMYISRTLWCMFAQELFSVITLCSFNRGSYASFVSSLNVFPVCHGRESWPKSVSFGWLHPYVPLMKASATCCSMIGGGWQVCCGL